MPERQAPTRQEIESVLWDRSNWGRWGKDDEMGAINLITPEKRIAAARLIRSGKSVSMGRFIPKTPGPGVGTPAQHWMRSRSIGDGGGGAASDFYGMLVHGGVNATHLDALCHVWDKHGIYNGRDPSEAITFDGATFGSVDKWSDGIVTRCILMDIPKLRGEPYVTVEKPVHGWELEDIVRAEGITMEPGDAIAIYCGRQAWEEAHFNTPWGASRSEPRPGVHTSCIPFIRDNDICLVAWDMQEGWPTGYEWEFPYDYSPVHAIIFAYGAAIVDNVALEPLAEALGAEGRSEFMLVLSPLKMAGGTGSPINPIALF